MPRKTDHVILCVRDLDAAEKAMRDLGFTVTPRADHPFGTAQVTVQLQDDTYIELVTVKDAAKLPSPESGKVSFPLHVKQFLDRREGFGGLVIATTDADAEHRRMLADNRIPAEVFGFSRQAEQPDGSFETVSFEGCTPQLPEWKDALVFFCRHLTPDAMRPAAFRTHKNGATGIGLILATAEEPAALHETLTDLLGEKDFDATSFGLDVPLDGAVLRILTPEGVRRFYGLEVTADEHLSFVAFGITTDGSAGLATMKPHPIGGAALFFV